MKRVVQEIGPPPLTHPKNEAISVSLLSTFPRFWQGFTIFLCIQLLKSLFFLCENLRLVLFYIIPILVGYLMSNPIYLYSWAESDC